MHDEQPTSLTLLQRAQGRDERAWQHLVTLYEPLVWHWCQRLGVERQDVPEVAQEVFFAIFGALPEFRRQRTGSFRTWVREIARHKVLDYFRRRKQSIPAVGGTAAFERLHEVPDPVGADGTDDAEEVAGLYRRALDLVRSEFESRTWHAFWRCAIDGHPTDAVAGELQMTPVAVRIAKSRVLARLREEAGELLE